ncbi:MAG: hypothetical protein V4857_01305 [Pseudomonadota bacterium]
MQTMRIALMLLLQPVRLRRTMGRPWMQWLMLALTASFTLWAMLGETKPAAGLACIVGAGQLVGWWALYLISIGLQFERRAIRMFPQLRRSAMATTVLVCLCLVLIIALAAGGVFGHHLQWALVAGLVLVFVALIVAGRGVFGFIALASAPLLLLELHEVAQIAGLFATPAGMAAGAALLGALMCHALQGLLGENGGDRPQGMFLQQWSHTVRGTEPGSGKLMASFGAVYAGCLRRDCARRDRQNLLMHGLGPNLHWTVKLSGQLPTLLVNAVLCLLLAQNPGAISGIVVGSVLVSQCFLQMEIARLAAGRPEQALLRLAPGLPGSDTLNRMLARGLLGVFFKNWSATMVCSALLLALVGVPRTQLIELMSAVAVSVLLAGGVLRNFALGSKGRDRIVVGLLFGLTLVLTLSMMLVKPRGPLAFVVALLVGVIVFWRWRAMLAAPPAFPAGRS